MNRDFSVASFNVPHSQGVEKAGFNQGKVPQAIEDIPKI